MPKKNKEERNKKLNEFGALMYKPFMILVLVFILIGMVFWIFTMVRNLKTDIFEEKLAQMQSVTLIGEGETIEQAVESANTKALGNFGECYQVSIEEISDGPWTVKVTYRLVGD